MREELIFGEKVQSVSYRERQGAYALIFNGKGEIALVNRGFGYFLPGGGVEANESEKECLERECGEEIGYDVEVLDYIGTASNYVVTFRSKEYVKLIGNFYITNLLEPNGLKIEQDHELVWVKIEEAEEKMFVEYQAWAVKKALELREISIKLLRFDEILEKGYLDYIEEWELSGEKIVPWASRREGLSFDNLIERWTRDEADEVYKNGFVPSTLYFLVDNERVLGAIHLRHELNEKLLQDGGHIGYGIRPSQRKKGYADLMLKKLLERLKEQDYNKVLITCDDENVGSARTIEKNGGIMENKLEFEGEVVRRYWIKL